MLGGTYKIMENENGELNGESASASENVEIKAGLTVKATWRDRHSCYHTVVFAVDRVEGDYVYRDDGLCFNTSEVKPLSIKEIDDMHKEELENLNVKYAILMAHAYDFPKDESEGEDTTITLPEEKA